MSKPVKLEVGQIWRSKPLDERFYISRIDGNSVYTRKNDSINEVFFTFISTDGFIMLDNSWELLDSKLYKCPVCKADRCNTANCE